MSAKSAKAWSAFFDVKGGHFFLRFYLLDSNDQPHLAHRYEPTRDIVGGSSTMTGQLPQ